MIDLLFTTTWYWQLDGKLKEMPAQLYDIDLFDTSRKTIRKLHKEGKIVICYFSAGSFEPWREDAARYQKRDLGNKMEGWEAERWVDVRSENVRSIILSRLDLANAKGCDGVEPDNVDGYENRTGFDLTFEDQLDFNTFLAREAHKRGLLVGLKNDVEQVKDLAGLFDFAINEECHIYHECGLYKPFIVQRKPLFNAEYAKKYHKKSAFRKLCKSSKKMGLHTLVLSEELDGSFVRSCEYEAGD